MPDTLYVDCFQSAHQNRRLSEKLNDISRVHAEEKHAKQGNIKHIDVKKNIIVNVKEESSNTAEYIYKWLLLKEEKGFIGCSNVEDREELDEEDTVIPVYATGDSHKTIKREEVLETELTVWRDDKPCGKGTVTLTDGTELWGTFRRGRREGRGSILGGKLYNMGVRSISGFFSAGVLEGGGRVEWIDGRFLEGDFRNGYLDGFCAAKSKSGGQDFYVSEYRRGVAGEDWRGEDGCMGWWIRQGSLLEKTSCTFTQTWSPVWLASSVMGS